MGPTEITLDEWRTIRKMLRTKQDIHLAVEILKNRDLSELDMYRILFLVRGYEIPSSSRPLSNPTWSLEEKLKKEIRNCPPWKDVVTEGDKNPELTIEFRSHDSGTGSYQYVHSPQVTMGNTQVVRDQDSGGYQQGPVDALLERQQESPECNEGRGIQSTDGR